MKFFILVLFILKFILFIYKIEIVINILFIFFKVLVQRIDLGKKSIFFIKKEVLVIKDVSSSKEFLEKFVKDKDLKEQRVEKLVLLRKESLELFQKLKGGYE